MSYPSGHTANTVVWYGVLVLLLAALLPAAARLGERSGARLALRLAPPAIVAVVTTYLGFHWITDTVAGLLAGTHPAQRRLVIEELLAHHLSLRRQRIAAGRTSGHQRMAMIELADQHPTSASPIIGVNALASLRTYLRAAARRKIAAITPCRRKPATCTRVISPAISNTVLPTNGGTRSTAPGSAWTARVLTTMGRMNVSVMNPPCALVIAAAAITIHATAASSSTRKFATIQRAAISTAVSGCWKHHAAT